MNITAWEVLRWVGSVLLVGGVFAWIWDITAVKVTADPERDHGGAIVSGPKTGDHEEGNS